MSARATWKGILQISAVTIPIKVYPATESSEKLSFNQLHSDCQTRVQQKRWCPKCEREVPSSEIVKGFEFEKDRYVILLDDELDAVAPPSTRVIDLTQFADASALSWTAIDRAYFLLPDGVHAAAAYAVMGEGMSGRVGIGKLAIYGREYLVAVRPERPVLMLYTLHQAAELRSVEAITNGAELPWAGTPRDAGGALLARQVITALTTPRLNLGDFTDAYQRDIRQLIDAKIAGEEIVVALPVESTPLLDLRAALEQSLLAVSAAKKPATEKLRMAKATTRARKRA